MSDNGEQLLVEREVELAELGRLVAEVERGSGRLTLIEGAPGIGKTRLLAEACDRARGHGFTVLSARGGELERDFAFGIVRQLLEPVLRDSGHDEREQLMAGAARFCEPVFSEPAAQTSQLGDPSYAILHGLYWLLSNLAERAPLVIAVDDAHWADAPSLRFVGFLARRLEEMGVLVALASRRGEPGAEADMLRSLWQELGGRPIEPALLSEEATAQIVRSTIGEADAGELCVACHEATRGNPFFLSELLVELAEREPGGRDPAVVRRLAPRGIAVAVLARLDRLPPGARALARAVALLGERAELSHAAALAGLERPEGRRLAERLAGATILERGRPLRFVHPVVRGAIYEEMPESERSEAHARAARLLAEAGREPDEVALQLLATEPDGDAWVVQTLREAARGALSQGAPEVASRYLRRALAESPEKRARLLVELGSAEARAREPGARAHLQAALQLAVDPPLKSLAALELCQVLSYGADTEGAARIALQTLEELGDTPPVRRLMKIPLLVFSQTDLAARQLTGQTVRDAASVVKRKREAAPAGLQAVMALEGALVDGRAAEVAVLAQLALADQRLDAEGLGVDAPHRYIASLAAALADRGELAETTLASALIEALEQGSARGFGVASAMRAWVRYRMGALAGAEADARAFLGLAADPGSHLFRPMALSALIDVLIERGEPAAAAAALEEWDLGPHARESSTAQPLRESRARLRLAEGKPRETLAELAACARWEQAWGAHNGVWVPWRSAATIAHLELGEQEEARRLVSEELQLAKRFGALRSIGIALSAAGLVERGERGIELQREAVSQLERSEAKLEHGRALVRLGAAIRRQGRRSQAREPLRAGLDLAERLGAVALSEAARQELLAAGARPRRATLTGRDALTPSERRVADLAATGQANRQIAQSLFLTVRTIEMHLTNAYRKLDIPSREQLPAALADEEPDVGATTEPAKGYCAPGWD